MVQTKPFANFAVNLSEPHFVIPAEAGIPCKQRNLSGDCGFNPQWRHFF